MKENSKEAEETGAILAYLLGEISKLLAPFAPFIAEKIWMELRQGSPTSSRLRRTSVHLEDWPSLIKPPRGKTLGVKSAKTPSVEEQGGILGSMQEVRHIVGLALEARQRAGMKVRQPLAKLEIKSKKLNIKNNEDFLELIKEEVNVKEVVFDVKLTEEVWLDTNITFELREEGMLRDLVREIQAVRKTAGLTPKDKVAAKLELPKEILEVAKKNEKVLAKETNLKSVQFSESHTTKISLK